MRSGAMALSTGARPNSGRSAFRFSTEGAVWSATSADRVGGRTRRAGSGRGLAAIGSARRDATHEAPPRLPLHRFRDRPFPVGEDGGGGARGTPSASLSERGPCRYLEL